MGKRILRGGLRSAIAIMLVLLTCLIAACQPTPEKEIIVNKGGGVEEALQQTPSGTFAPYLAPARWSETVQKDKLKIVIDTDVVLPGVSAYPVIKLEPRIFTQPQVDALVRYFAAGKKLYKPHVRTKADYEADIVLAMKGHEVDGEYVFDESDQEWVDQLKEQMEAASEDSPVIYTDTTLTYRTDDETGKEDSAGGKNF